MHTLKFRLQLLKQQNVHFQNTTSTYQKPYPLSNNFQNQCHRLECISKQLLGDNYENNDKTWSAKKMMAVDTCEKMTRM